MAYTNETLPKTEFESNIQRPAMMKVGSKHFVVPIWLEVTADFDLDKALSDGLIVNTMKYTPVVKENILSKLLLKIVNNFLTRILPGQIFLLYLTINKDYELHTL